MGDILMNKSDVEEKIENETPDMGKISDNIQQNKEKLQIRFKNSVDVIFYEFDTI
jgi:hypothetical protein